MLRFLLRNILNVKRNGTCVTDVFSWEFQQYVNRSLVHSQLNVRMVCL